MHKTQEVGRVVFPADQQAPLPLQSRKEALDEPAALIAAAVAAILRLEFPGRSMWRDHVHAILFEVIIERHCRKDTERSVVLSSGRPPVLHFDDL
ncbi:MAG: hypothetical protein AABZ34_16525 [Nitrospirota bacterium]